ncbi:alpha/beta hydrolase family protein [Peristeroidobacter agariperforans]|uniref:alpha/beta hydrolase family protein n=1 Tax=Peristeroidobacter agariperforans TaxID=268404 RepID=UPI00101B7E33|nr:alpha/beta family hydrolase [Peristeroidobacter agariperforans]
MTASSTPLSIEVKSGLRVSALLQLPPQARACFVLGHGAGAGMAHAFMTDLANALEARQIGTLRYNFPYMESGSKRPDPPALCHATVRAAVEEARKQAPGVALIAGGKSFGGRMTSQAQAAKPLPEVRGLAFVGFPLHPAKKPSTERATHLSDVQVPMLFLQGTRDELADLTLLEPIVQKLGPGATMKRIEGADHSFHVLARSGRNDREVMAELADTIASWAANL